MSAPHRGATVIFCGHKGTFLADVWRVRGVNIVRASRPISPDTLDRETVESATHHVVDFPIRGFWRPDLGILVVPCGQVRKIKKEIY